MGKNKCSPTFILHCAFRNIPFLVCALIYSDVAYLFGLNISAKSFYLYLGCLNALIEKEEEVYLWIVSICVQKHKGEGNL